MDCKSDEKQKHFIDSISHDLEERLSRKEMTNEPEFENIGVEEGFQIWRIEKLKLVKWPKERYGTFYNGDTYIVIKTASNSEKNVHLWLGEESTPDEIGYGSFKILQLEGYLKCDYNIFYETEKHESEIFRNYFPFITICQGGVEAESSSEKTEKYTARGFHIKGIGSNVSVGEVPILESSLNSGDVFIFDTGYKIFNWIGMLSSPFEKIKGTFISDAIKKKRNGNAEIISIEQENKSEENGNNLKMFDKLFEKYKMTEARAPEKNGTQTTTGIKKEMLNICDNDGKGKGTPVPLARESLLTDDAFLIDRGDAIIIWIGKKASAKEKKYAFIYAKRYVVNNHRNLDLPIIVINEGKMQKELDKCFN